MTTLTRDTRAARFLVTNALLQGWTVSVNDGEEWTVKSSKDKEAILSAMQTTDTDTLRFRDADGKTVGSIWLVWGNDGECFADGSCDNGVYDVFTERFMNFIDTLTDPRRG